MTSDAGIGEVVWTQLPAFKDFIFEIGMVGTPPTSQLASTLLHRAHPPETASRIFTETVLHRPLLLRPSSPPPPGQDARSLRQQARKQKKELRKRRKPKPLSAKQKRALCLYEIPRSEQKYAIYEPLHRMWCDYMRDILGLNGPTKQYITAANSGPVLGSAEYIGALVTVVRSRCVGRVGITGIVVKDTKSTFEIVTRKDILKTVPKEHTVFRFEVPLANPEQVSKGEAPGMDVDGEPKPMIFELHGSRFEYAAADRANKKFKQHIPEDI